MYELSTVSGLVMILYETYIRLIQEAIKGFGAYYGFIWDPHETCIRGFEKALEEVVDLYETHKTHISLSDCCYEEANSFLLNFRP